MNRHDRERQERSLERERERERKILQVFEEISEFAVERM
jgi:hypothetical protein